MTTTEHNIEWYLNKMLVWNLDNHDQEYNKLFKIGTIQLKELLELEKKNFIDSILHRIKWAELYNLWMERVDKEVKQANTQEECKLYIEWYNKAVENCNNTVHNFCEYFEDIINKL